MLLGVVVVMLNKKYLRIIKTDSLPEHMSSPPVLVGFVLLDLYIYV